MIDPTPATPEPGTRPAASADDTLPVDPRYRDPSLSIEERVENLLGQLTLEEKAGLFFQTMITIGKGGQVAGPTRCSASPTAPR